jgi:hypothetical protein
MYPWYRIFQSISPVMVVAGAMAAPKAAAMNAPVSKSFAPVASYSRNDASETGKSAWGKWTNIG